MRIQFRHNAGQVETPKGTFPERFAPDAFDSQIDKEVPFKLENRKVGTATLIAAEVIDDGCAALLTYEVHRPEVSAFLRDDLLTHTGPGLSFKMTPATPR